MFRVSASCSCDWRERGDADAWEWRQKALSLMVQLWRISPATFSPVMFEMLCSSQLYFPQRSRRDFSEKISGTCNGDCSTQILPLRNDFGQCVVAL